MEEIIKLNNEKRRCSELLNSFVVDPEMILDGEIVDKNTFETLRKATEQELEWFYTIRIIEMKIRRLQNK